MAREHGPKALRFSEFDVASFPDGVATSNQVAYLRSYLADLAAQSILEEPQYFDRDYLAEFTAFYGTSARGYENVCRRLHLFSVPLPELRVRFARATAGDDGEHRALQERYLGFVVIRPTVATPFGRTVLRWYPETKPATPRVTSPSRPYETNVAGIRFTVRGLAWQQQDTAVGACATVALWSMFHSSALDEHHSIPTTADVTKAANEGWSIGRRPFPAGHGLQVEQMCEAIRAQKLAPAVFEGDRRGGMAPFFSPARFRSTCAALLRSGYPILVGALVLEDDGSGGYRQSGRHAVCAVGFRTAATPTVPAGAALEDDAALEHIYLHDDNLGPSVRFRVLDVPPPSGVAGDAFVALVADPPPPLNRPPETPDPTADYMKLVPTTLVAALPDEIRMSSDLLHDAGLGLASVVSKWLESVSTGKLPGLTFGTRFFRVKDYVAVELAARVSGRALSKARVALATRVRPMSLHVGVIRIGIAGRPWFDVLYDTTDSEPATLAFAHVVFHPGGLPPVLRGIDLGVHVRAV